MVDDEEYDDDPTDEQLQAATDALIRKLSWAGLGIIFVFFATVLAGYVLSQTGL